MEQELAAYSFNYPLVVSEWLKVVKFDSQLEQD